MSLVLAALVTPAAAAAGPGGGASAPLADHRVPPAPEPDAAALAARAAVAARRDRPGALQERRNSRSAYRDLTRSEAVELAQDAFPELTEPAYRPLALSADERVAAWLGPRAARVERPGAPDLLVESPLPLRTAGEDGRPAAVDLSLRHTGESFEPLAPLVSLEVDDAAQAGVRLDDIGVAVKPVGVADAPGVARQDKAFFPETAPDTDHVVTPLPAGVDLGAQLRSPASPERFRWRVQLPPGASLRPADTGAKIVSAGGATLAHITAPVAWDADDHPVPARMTIEGADIVVDVAHRDADVRYPILLDPTILEDVAYWFGLSAFVVDASGWQFSNPSGRFLAFTGSAFLGSGLYAYSRGPKAFEAGDYANWFLNAPGTSRIVRAQFSAVRHDPQTSGAWAAPFNDDRSYQGVWSYQENRYERGTWCDALVTCGASPFSTYGPLLYTTKTHFDLEGTPGNAAIFGTGVFYAGIHTSFTNYLGGASVWIEDATPPVVSEDNGLSDVSWASSRAFRATATDSGLGMRTLVLDSPAHPEWKGGYSYTAACTGDRRSRCPQSLYAYSDSTGLPEGVVPVRFTATDAVGNVSTRTWNLRIDRTAPLVERPADDELRLLEENGEAHAMTVVARDGQGSGVRTIDFALVDAQGGVVEQLPDPAPQDCEAACTKERTWSAPTAGLPDGQYTLQATATDHAGLVTTQAWPLTIGGVPPINHTD